MPLQTGDIVKDRYRIVAQLGQGGMAIVYRAWDLSLKIPVALKEMTPQPGLDQETLAQLQQQFRKEAQTVARLNHPNLVKVTDFFELKGISYFVMDYVAGNNLASLIEQQGTLPEQKVISVGEQILDALIHCHSQAVVHRDIKPENIVIQADGRIKLVDFGLVKLWNPGDPRTQKVLQGMGTPEYAPPEQYGINSISTDARSDLYSLGATLYHALAGYSPLTVTDRMAFPQKFRSLAQINQQLSPHIRNTVEKAMELSPNDRFPDAQSMKNALLGFALPVDDRTELLPSDLRPIASSPTFYEPTPAPAVKPQRKWLWAVLGVLLIAVIGSGVWFFGLRASGVEDRVAEAQALVAAGEYDEAVSALEGILAEVPGEETVVIGLNNALLARAKAAMEQGDYEQAEEDLERLLAREPDDATLNMLMADLLAQQGRYNESIPYYILALRTDNSAVVARAGLAWAYYHTNQFENAIPEFALLANANPLDSAKGLGLSYIGLEWYDDALLALRRWSELEPTSLEPHKHLGLTYRTVGSLDNAVTHFRRWEQLAKEEAEVIDARLNLGETLFELRLYSEAVKVFEQATNQAPDSLRAWSGLAHTYRTLREYDKVLRALERALELAPDNASIIGRLGEIYSLLENYETAVTYYETAIALDNTVANHCTGLGNAWRALRNFTQAITAYKCAAELEPDDPMTMSRIAGSYFALEAYEEAVTYYEKAIALDDSVANFFIGIGNSQRERRHCLQAIAAYNQAIELEPDNHLTYARAGSCYLVIENYEEALAHYEQAITLDSNVASYHNGHGQALRRLGNCEEAISAFTHALDVDPTFSAARQGLEACQANN